MVAVVEVRRLLHVNYNCVDAAVLERWYVGLFSLDVRMRSDATDTDGTPFGLEMPTSHRTAFLYDHRGPRRATSLELVKWRVPATIGRPYLHPWDHGIQALGFSAPDLDEVARQATGLGGEVVRRTSEVLLLRDPEGVWVEVHPARDARPEQLHLRIVVHDLARTRDWWSGLGFGPAAGATLAAPEDIWTAGDEHRVEDEAAMVATDDPTFALRFTSWEGPPPVGPTYGVPFHRGLYRMAMAVDDVFGAFETLRDAGLAIQPPYTFALPGTKITEGLTILFLRDPDGILVELVERPRSHFR